MAVTNKSKTQVNAMKYPLRTGPVTIADVPCGACRLCCKGDAIFLHPEHGDSVDAYQTEVHAAFPDRVMLAHKPNGDCIYLSDSGCSIHGKAPSICREFDCRKLVENLGYTKARKMVKAGVISGAMVRRGKELKKGAR